MDWLKVIVHLGVAETVIKSFFVVLGTSNSILGLFCFNNGNKEVIQGKKVGQLLQSYFFLGDGSGSPARPN